MAAFFRKVGLGLFVTFVVLYALGASYYLPRTEHVVVTGTEIKRSDKKLPDGSTRTQDVRYVMTKRLSDGKPMVFRNEDTGWSWPPYFKFDSGDVAGEAMNIAKTNSDATVFVRYYGWRTNMFSLYPNLVSLDVVDSDDESFPVFNVIFVVFSAAVFLVLFIWVRRLARWRPFRKKEAVTPEGSDGASAEADPPQNAAPPA